VIRHLESAAVAEAWREWWRQRGEERLSLLLWAVWNPIGPAPLDEYEDYTGEVVRVLEKAHVADEELSPPGSDPDDAIQRQRNALYASAVHELATLLGRIRIEEMEMPSNPDGDHRAAETLLEWYEWEMSELARDS
jgi:hypothetical protein